VTSSFHNNLDLGSVEKKFPSFQHSRLNLPQVLQGNRIPCHPRMISPAACGRASRGIWAPESRSTGRNFAPLTQLSWILSQRTNTACTRIFSLFYGKNSRISACSKAGEYNDIAILHFCYMHCMVWLYSKLKELRLPPHLSFEYWNCWQMTPGDKLQAFIEEQNGSEWGTS